MHNIIIRILGNGLYKRLRVISLLGGWFCGLMSMWGKLKHFSRVGSGSPHTVMYVASFFGLVQFCCCVLSVTNVPGPATKLLVGCCIILGWALVSYFIQLLWLHRNEFYTQAVSYTAYRESSSCVWVVELVVHARHLLETSVTRASLITQRSDWYSQYRLIWKLLYMLECFQLESSSLPVVPSMPMVKH